VSIIFWRVLMYTNTACAAAWAALYIMTDLGGALLCSILFLIMTALCWVAALKD
jgi:hypothetical protein